MTISRATFYSFGLPAAALVSAPRAVSSVDVVGDVFVLEGHGFADGDQVRITSVGGDIPTGLFASTLYTVETVGADMFRLVSNPLVDEGSGLIYIIKDLTAQIDACLDLAEAEVANAVVAHMPPFEDLPLVLVGLACRRAARQMLVTRGLANPAYADSARALLDMQRPDEKELDRFRAGKPVHAPNVVDATPDVAEFSSASWADEARGWSNARIL